MPSSTRKSFTDPFASEEAFRDLVERSSRRLFRVAWRITGNSATAEDVVQEAFLRAYQGRDDFDRRSKPETWLHRIAVNLSLDVVRQSNRSGDALPRADTLSPAVTDWAASGDPGPWRHTASRQLAERMECAVDELTELERAAFSGRHLEGRSIADLSEELDVGRSASKQAVFRAVGKLRKALRMWKTPTDPDSAHPGTEDAGKERTE